MTQEIQKLLKIAVLPVFLGFGLTHMSSMAAQNETPQVSPNSIDPCSQQGPSHYLNLELDPHEVKNVLLPQSGFMRQFVEKNRLQSRRRIDLNLSFEGDPDRVSKAIDSATAAPTSVDYNELMNVGLAPTIITDVFQARVVDNTTTNGINLGQVTSVVMNGLLGLAGKSPNSTSSASNLGTTMSAGYQVPCQTIQTTGITDNLDLHGNYALSRNWEVYFHGQIMHCQFFQGSGFGNFSYMVFGAAFRF